MALNIKQLRKNLQDFDFRGLFNELGWNNPASTKTSSLKTGDTTSQYRQIATLGGVIVLEIENPEALTNKKLRENIQKEVSKLAFENLIIFTNDLNKPEQSLWYWVKRDGKKRFPREHLFVKGQTGDLFISKITSMFVDLSELDERGNLDVTNAVRRLEGALDVNVVTKKFYKAFSEVRIEFKDLISGISDEKDQAHYASVLMHRLMFIYFLQAKGFLDTERGANGNREYLSEKLEAYKNTDFYADFLRDLFFKGFALPDDHPEKQAVTGKIGKIKYLNGGLFLPHRIETENPGIQVKNKAFENLFKLFGDYSWNLDDTPGGNDDEINPDVLGYIFEKYINQKAFGAYYTRTEITEYLCKQTIEKLILQKVNEHRGIPGLKQPKILDYNAMLVSADANLCRELIGETVNPQSGILPNLKLLDPACGSGAFLIAALKTLMEAYGAILGRIDMLNDLNLNAWKKKLQGDRITPNYVIKRRIVTDNLFGVDLMPEATDIARLRLFLAMVSSANSVEELEPLPNIDFNILSGNSLIGLMHVDPQKFDSTTDKAKTDKVKTGNNLTALFDMPEQGMSTKTYSEVIKQRRIDLDSYRHVAEKGMEDLQRLRDNLEQGRKEALGVLNPMLVEEFRGLKIQFEQASWDASKNTEGKTTKRALTLEDILILKPFHWGFEFSDVMDRGGFDAIIANPPWDILKPNDKEFLQDYDSAISINKMGIKELEAIKNQLLKKPEVRLKYETYLSGFPHQSAYYRAAPQFKNQSSVVNGKRTGTDINLYKLFLEQSYNLLRDTGECGIVIPSGIYTDLGAKGLRELLFEKTTLTGLFGFENRKEIFEGVHRSFKFVVLSFEKSGNTTAFPAAFMRLNVSDLEQFPTQTGLKMQVELIKRLSPDSMSIMEFQSEADVKIAEKMLMFPLLGEKLEHAWNLKLSNEFHMTNDSHLFKTSSGTGRLPLFTGKMFHQFENTNEHSGYWIDEGEGRKALLGRSEDIGQKSDYQSYRWLHRRIARNTDSRTLITTITPKMVFTEVNSTTLKVIETEITETEMLFLCAVSNSFSLDWFLRQKVTTTLNMFYIYQLPVPRLTSSDPRFKPITTRAARLICTTPEYDDLARSAGLRDHTDGATIPAERAKLRAELDGLIAHLYNLTEDEFAHILETFPLVPEPVRLAARNAYRDVQRGLIP
jgi:hypothetical protein